MKAVFDTREDSIYDDDVAHRYHFPSRYLDTVRECLGDWIVYRQPRAGHGSMSYFAVARVLRIEPDQSQRSFSYAIMSDFLAFDRPVPWRVDGRYAEAALRNITNVPQVGLYLRGRSVRVLNEIDFNEIVLAGLHDTLAPENAVRFGLERPDLDQETAALVEDAAPAANRRVVRMLVNRKIREASFRRNVCLAYDDRCAITGLKIVNGGGKAEVQAAHIRPVAEGGPDTVQNGIALSGTVHWLFDRHLITLTDEFGLLVSHNKVPSELRPLFERQLRRIHLPASRHLWPSLDYVRRHREAFVGG